MYPSIAMAMNIAKSTKFSTVLHIEGAPFTLEQINEAHTNMKNETNPKTKSVLKQKYDEMTLANTEWIDEFFGKLATTEENAVDLCHQIFNLPNYSEMAGIFREFYKQTN